MQKPFSMAIAAVATSRANIGMAAHGRQARVVLGLLERAGITAYQRGSSGSCAHANISNNAVSATSVL